MKRNLCIIVIMFLSLTSGVVLAGYEPVELGNGYFVSLDEGTGSACLWDVTGTRIETVDLGATGEWQSIAAGWPGTVGEIGWGSLNSSLSLSESDEFPYQITGSGSGFSLAIGDQVVHRYGQYRHVEVPAGALVTSLLLASVGDAVTSNLSVSSVATALCPQVSFQNLRNGDIVGTTPLLEANVYSVSGSIDTARIYIADATAMGTTYSVATGYYTDETVTLSAGSLSFTTAQAGMPALADGQHTIQLYVTDTNGNVGTASLSLYVESDFQIRNLYNVPNPVTEGSTDFTYYLTQAASEVTIRIFNVNGQLLKTINSSATSEGFNRVYWDLNNSWGRGIANDVYIYVVEAVGVSGERVREKGKIMVVR